MRDNIEDSNSGSWPLYYGEKPLSNGQYCTNGYLTRPPDGYLGYNKDDLKQTMLKHEAIFKNQVYELHRLYRKQRDLMDEVKRKDLNKHQIPLETSSSSSPFASQMPSEDARHLKIPGLPSVNSMIANAENIHSPLSFIRSSTTQAGYSGKNSKDADGFDSRPTKVRRKMFDLHLPADEYIDTEEEGEQTGAPKVTNMSSYYLSDGNLKPNSCFERTRRMADLNEPVRAEEGNVINSFNREINGQDLSAEKKIQFSSFPKETLQNFQHENGSGSSNNLHLGNNGNRREWFSYTHETGIDKSDLKAISHSQYILNNVHEPTKFLPTDQQGKKDPWRERTVCGLQICEKIPNFHIEPFVGSNITTPYPKMSTNHKSELSNQNGFCVGSSSGSKELGFPSDGLDYRNWSFSGILAPDHPFISSTKHLKAVNNSVLLKSISSQKHLEGPLVLPWLRDSKRDTNSGQFTFPQPSVDQFFNNKMEIEKGLTSDVESKRKIEMGDRLSNTKILGFPLFEKPHNISKNDSSLTSVSVSSHPHVLKGEKDSEKKRKNGVLIDINVACDPTVPDLGKHINAEKAAALRNFIDLNSCVSEDEASLVPSVPSTDVKVVRGIDLEAPLIPEVEENNFLEKQMLENLSERVSQSPKQEDDLVNIAAEAIVAISSSADQHCNSKSANVNCHPSEASLVDTLQWFVDVVSSFSGDLEKFLKQKDKHGKENEESSSDDSDYFEAMTLRLEETKAEDYLPKPLILENPNAEEEKGAVLLSNRPRKGARRGRQRRDFQRDILPGLASLSRHEVTEDLQTFGGLMRATGQTWQSGLTRRNAAKSGGMRGRRRQPAASMTPICTPLMQQINSNNNSYCNNNHIEVGLEDGSLTGWGKTTRRPRRQRCPAGNPPLPPPHPALGLT